MNDANATDDESKVKKLSTTEDIQEKNGKKVSIVSEMKRQLAIKAK